MELIRLGVLYTIFRIKDTENFMICQWQFHIQISVFSCLKDIEIRISDLEVRGHFRAWLK